MPRAMNGSVELEYETFGDVADPTVLLISGLGSQMIGYDTEYCVGLADRGRHVVRFDNRDVGASTWLEDHTADVAAAMASASAGEPVSTAYLLTDMAADAVAVLDAAGVDRARVTGMSMGGMIAQTVAIEHPERVSSLVSIMSTTGDRDVGRPDNAAREVLLAPPPIDRDGALDAAEVWARAVGSPDHLDADWVRARAAAAYDRAFNPPGTARQLVAIWASGSRSEALAELDVPTLVIHGALDPLIPLDAGQRTAEVIPGAELQVVADQGHDLPPALWPTYWDALCD